MRLLSKGDTWFIRAPLIIYRVGFGQGKAMKPQKSSSEKKRELGGWGGDGFRMRRRNNVNRDKKPMIGDRLNQKPRAQDKMSKSQEQDEPPIKVHLQYNIYRINAVCSEKKTKLTTCSMQYVILVA